MDPGYFAVYMGTSPEKVDAAIDGIRQELLRVRDEPVSEQELSRARWGTAIGVGARLMAPGSHAMNERLYTDMCLWMGKHRMKLYLLLIALGLFNGCVASVLYWYDTELPVLMVGGKPDEDTRIVPKGRPPIPPVKFGQWFIPSSWAIKLGVRWADLPYAFDPKGPEYCAALGVDRERMLNASTPVRYRGHKAETNCPALVWRDDDFMVSLSTAHGHQTLQHHGERISVQDATLGGPLLVGTASNARIEMLRVAVNFYSGERLMGIDPATGKEAPVPAQSLLFTRFNGAVHVFLWTPLADETEGRSNFVRVYKPARDDGWEEVGICWVEADDVRRAAARRAHPMARCNPDDFWLK